MARIKHHDHARILQLADVEHRRVSEIAAEYGCAPATVSALLVKLRRTAASVSAVVSPTQPPLGLEQAVLIDVGPPPPEMADPFEAASVAPATADASGDAATAADTVNPDVAVIAAADSMGCAATSADCGNIVPFEAMGPTGSARAEAAPAVAATRTRPVAPASAAPMSPRQRGGGRGGSAPVGGRLAKPGFGLMMRTADGEENLTPFRSLEDLLSAIKPILRACAGSPEPVWFSLQPVDLAMIDTDAA